MIPPADSCLLSPRHLLQPTTIPTQLPTYPTFPQIPLYSSSFWTTLHVLEPIFGPPFLLTPPPILRIFNVFHPLLIQPSLLQLATLATRIHPPPPGLLIFGKFWGKIYEILVYIFNFL